MRWKKEFLVKVLSSLRPFRSELILVSLSGLITIVSLVIFVFSKQSREKIIFESASDLESKPSLKIAPAKIVVDIQGAVEKPDAYELTVGARLKDLLVMAQGLSAEADRQFFNQSFNLAKILTDQEKIYIPSVEEVKQGQVAPAAAQVPIDKKINLNQASVEELESLPGVGKVTAQKIIDGRPYSQIEDLLNKKAVSKSVYEKIKDKIKT